MFNIKLPIIDDLKNFSWHWSKKGVQATQQISGSEVKNEDL